MSLIQIKDRRAPRAKLARSGAGGMQRVNTSAMLGNLVRPAPLWLLQALLDRIVRHVANRHPEAFARLGDKTRSAILIDPSDMPFVLLLRPDPDAPRMMVVRRGVAARHDASVRATFLTLFRTIDAALDGDALFFSRELAVEGDVEAVVRLRNAIDDVDGSIAAEVAALHGPLGRLGLRMLRRQGGAAA